MLASEDIQRKAKNNTIDNFKFAFEKSFMNFVIDRIGSNEKLHMKILENDEFKTIIMEDMMNEIYSEVNS